MANVSAVVFGGLAGNSIMQYNTADTLATITAPGYLNATSTPGYNDFLNASWLFIIYSGGSGLFSLTSSAGVITLAPIASNQGLSSGIANPDQSPDLVSFDVAASSAALASGGAVTLVASSGTKRYRVRVLQLNSNGTNFSGGGDRLAQVTDGTTVYSLIPAASLQTLVNAQWGATALPNPASAAIDTQTVAGASLTLKYSGGTTDYTAGSVVISGIAERVV